MIPLHRGTARPWHPALSLGTAWQEAVPRAGFEPGCGKPLQGGRSGLNTTDVYRRSSAAPSRVPWAGRDANRVVFLFPLWI